MDAQPSNNSDCRHARIELKHLRLAVLACSCGSLRRAADVLGVRHSALSRSVIQLEQLVGATLFERSSAGIRPTQAGSSFLSRATAILERIEALVQSAGYGAVTGSSQFSVGLCTSGSTRNLRAILADLGRHDIEVTAIERSPTDLNGCLRSGVADAIIVPEGPRSIDLESRALWCEGIVVLLAADNTLATREVIYWTDLLNQTILLGTSEHVCSLTKIIEPYLVAQGIGQKVQRHNVSRHVIHGLASAGLGVSFMLASNTKSIGDDLIWRELRDGRGQMQVCFHVHWLRGNENPALKRFLRLLADYYPSSAIGG
ncbi:LysR family transcriptional regulator [Bradyrhizobium sp. CCGB20]|uniref:LysR family transcriptional regulator n=1 Tax=Bradyrhizobium sp. CCGB20 TaxID=2949633 RepID=UPI0035C6BD4C